MKPLRILLPVLFAILTSFASVQADEPAADGEWTPLFNGKNLDGWKIKIRGYDLGENFGNTFRVEDGLLKVSYDQYDKFNERYGHIFYEKPFSHYILRVEYRFVGEQVAGGPGWAFRNNGIMFHGQTPESMGKDQSFPVSIEVQLLGGSGKGKRSTANVCTPGTNFVQNGKLITSHCNSSSSKTYNGDQWVTVEVEVHGSELIRHRVNGELVFEYTQPQLDPKDGDAKKLIHGDNLLLDRGTISLQAESAPCEFRKIEIKVLDE